MVSGGLRFKAETTSGKKPGRETETLPGKKPERGAETIPGKKPERGAETDVREIIEATGGTTIEDTSGRL
jgi:hypothetical protein